MKYSEAIKILEKHNRWRRSGYGEMVNPTELGLSIDCIVEEAKNQKPAAVRDKIERTNKDTFKNFKAQSWWSLRLRFERTYRAVVHGEKFDEAMKADNVPQ